MSESKKKLDRTKKNYLILGSIVIILVATLFYTINGYENYVSYYKNLALDYKNKNKELNQQNVELNEQLEDAQPWFNMSKDEKQKTIDNQKAEQKAKEKEKEEKEKQEELEKSREGKTAVNAVNPETGKTQKIYVNNETVKAMEKIYKTKCPYCGGTYIVDGNDNSEYCEDCGYSSYD